MHEYCLVILLQINGSTLSSNDSFCSGIQHLEKGSLNRRTIYQMNTSFKKTLSLSLRIVIYGTFQGENMMER